MSDSWSFAELFVPESDAAVAARDRAADLGCTPVSPGAGATLRFLAAAASARSVVEIGTGAGVSGLHLLDGMVDGGILTSIDIESEHQRVAKQSFTDAGIAPGRARLINGRALDVLPRLTDAAYDLVLVDGAPEEYPHYVDEAVRLLRLGGIVALVHALAGDRVSDPTQRDPQTVAVREAGRAIRDHEGLVPVMLPIGDGVLAAVRRA